MGREIKSILRGITVLWLQRSRRMRVGYITKDCVPVALDSYWDGIGLGANGLGFKACGL